MNSQNTARQNNATGKGHVCLVRDDGNGSDVDYGSRTAEEQQRFEGTERKSAKTERCDVVYQWPQRVNPYASVLGARTQVVACLRPRFKLLPIQVSLSLLGGGVE